MSHEKCSWNVLFLLVDSERIHKSSAAPLAAQGALQPPHTMGRRETRPAPQHCSAGIQLLPSRYFSPSGKCPSGMAAWRRTWMRKSAIDCLDGLPDLNYKNNFLTFTHKPHLNTWPYKGATVLPRIMISWFYWRNWGLKSWKEIHWNLITSSGTRSQHACPKRWQVEQ